jgi:hypothetical protein
MINNNYENTNNVEMSVNYLANFIFLENTKDIKITLQSDEFDNAKDMFFFILDLYFKGMVLLYGKKNDNFSSSVILNELSLEQIDFIKDKLKNAHIKLNFDYYHYTNIEEGNLDILEKYKKSNMTLLTSFADNLNIKEYIFKLSMGEYIYFINFEILHFV